MKFSEASDLLQVLSRPHIQGGEHWGDGHRRGERRGRLVPECPATESPHVSRKSCDKPQYHKQFIHHSNI